MHALSCSVCLTYDPEHLPALGSLEPEDPKRLINSLRKRIERRGGPPLSFDYVGEYSPWPALRPHYHLALWSYFPPDAQPLGKSRAGNDEYSSKELTDLWGKGRVTFQRWDHGAANYIAGHSANKLEASKVDLRVFDQAGRLVGERHPEFHRCSRNPAPGRRFFEKYGEQALQLGYTVVGGRQVAVPAYYVRRGKADMPELTEKHRAQRLAKALEAAAKADAGPPVDSIEYCARQRIERGARRNGL